MNRFWLLLGLCLSLALGCKPAPPSKDQVLFSVSLPDSLQQPDQHGRLLLMLSTDDSAEPRFQVNDGPDTQLLFGVEVEGLEPGQTVDFRASDLGYPIERLADVPPGPYYVQALFHQYEAFQLATGHSVHLPMDRGEGQQWNRSPGNVYSQPRQVRFRPDASSPTPLALTEVIPPITPPEDTKYIKHVRIQSELLTEFWGRPMYLGAHVLLPEGFDEHPDARYPLAIMHGHFPYDFGGFRTTPPDEDLEPVYSERFGVEGYNRIEQQEAYDFYRSWTGPDFPRVLAIKIQHANPYYDDSYAVNSANLGPYGDAITYELIPYIEERFRGLGEGWARFVYGGSTGGWEALAVQVMYPDEYNSCFAACPDPIDFRAYMLMNIYEDQNAYFYPSKHKEVLRPGHRDYLGNVNASIRDMNLRELALGTKNRSGQQFDIWEAVYSPQGEDGYPKRLWDKYTGEIDPEVATYWRDHYDLTHIMRRDWETLGPKLRGKINIYCGDMDNYYLNNAVYLAEDFLETAQPAYEGEVDYGDRAEHCWNGDHEHPNHISRLRYHRMFVPKGVAHILASAPKGADLDSWRY